MINLIIKLIMASYAIKLAFAQDQTEYILTYADQESVIKLSFKDSVKPPLAVDSSNSNIALKSDKNNSCYSVSVSTASTIRAISLIHEKINLTYRIVPIRRKNYCGSMSR
jgi:hypothetical protein